MANYSNIALIIICFVFIALVYYIYSARNSKTSLSPETSAATAQLQLSAYERLILLVDRIALHNLISRLKSARCHGSREMQHVAYPKY